MNVCESQPNNQSSSSSSSSRTLNGWTNKVRLLLMICCCLTVVGAFVVFFVQLSKFRVFLSGCQYVGSWIVIIIVGTVCARTFSTHKLGILIMFSRERALYIRCCCHIFPMFVVACYCHVSQFFFVLLYRHIHIHV